MDHREDREDKELENFDKMDENIGIIDIRDEMKSSYMDYAMSVIVSRALPDVRDGLKPVHRRILYAQYENGYTNDKPYRKSAKTVGDVMGKYHPHGDAAIYDSMVRMAQEFSLRETLIDGQGNFGSMDGDPPAAMRYTESRLSKISNYLLTDIEKETVDFIPNYDNSEEEPVVLPAKFPNLLVNGAGGIAVGMATNIPPHNLSEVIDGICAYIDNNDISIEELIEYIQGPDFPTGGQILGRSGILDAYKTGRGRIVYRGKTHIEENKNTSSIVISEIPYMVNKAKLVEKIASLVAEKKIENISDLRDESNKDGVRVVIDLKKDANPEFIENQLYSYTELRTSFCVNMLAIDNKMPKMMNLLDVVKSFVDFREEVVTKRTIFLLEKAKNKAHLLIGLYVAVANIDKIIEIIKSSQNTSEAKERLLKEKWESNDIAPLIELIENTTKLIATQNENNLVENNQISFSNPQVKAILEMKLQRLTAMEQNKISEDLHQIAEEIKYLFDLLSSREKLFDVIKDELKEVQEKFGNPRKTEIIASEFEQDLESLIPEEEMVVTLTTENYIKRVPLDTYSAQRRGGKGRSALSMKEEDILKTIINANTHSVLLFFSNIGKVYSTKLYNIPLGSTQSKGKPIVNLLPLENDEYITNIMAVDSNALNNKKQEQRLGDDVTLNEFGDWVEDSDTSSGNSDKLADKSSDIDFDQELNKKEFLIFATKSGKIRKSSVDSFASIKSNGKIAIKLNELDKLINVRLASNDDHVFITTKMGKSIRFPLKDLRVIQSRSSDGVVGMKLRGNDEVISMHVISSGGNKSSQEREAFLSIPKDVREKIAQNLLSKQELDQLKNDEIINKDIDTELIQDMINKEEFILSISEKGLGKLTSSYYYKHSNRGGMGVTSMNITNKTGLLIASMKASLDDELMLVTGKGKIIRIKISDIAISGRVTSGVILFKTEEDEKIVSTSLIKSFKEEENQDAEINENEDKHKDEN